MNAERKEKQDITGQRWGRLVAVRQIGYTTIERTGKRQALWLWHCDCGNEKEIPATQVKHGRTRSCGCMATEHITNLRKEDITGQRFGKLVAICPTPDRDKTGGVIWELACDCGNKVYKTINVLKTGRVLSCGCLYKETRADTFRYRKDFVESTSLSSIVASKRLRSNNTSGHTGVYLNKRTERWEAFIHYQKKRFHLGSFKDKEDAIRVRKEAEAKIHDPVILAYWDNLTEERKLEFSEYLQAIGAESELPKLNLP